MEFFRRSLLVSTLAGAGLVSAIAPAYASEATDAAPGSVVSVDDVQPVTPVNACNNDVPANALGAQVPVEDVSAVVPLAGEDEGGAAAPEQQSCGSDADAAS